MANTLQTTPIVSRNGRLVFFNTTDYNARLRQKYSDGEWQLKQELALHPMLLDWLPGFSGFESAPGKTWRWCSNEGVLQIHNTSQRSRKIRLEMYFATGHEQFASLSINGAGISEELQVNASPRFYSKTLEIPPGKSTIKFSSNAQRVNAPLDPRYLIFRIEDFKLTELEYN